MARKLRFNGLMGRRSLILDPPSRIDLPCKRRQRKLTQLVVDSLKLQLDDLEKQMDSLKAAFVPIQDEVDRLEELGNMICAEEREISSLMLGSKQLKEKDIDKSSTEINRRKVQIETGQKMMKKLTKGIEELKNEKERLTQEREKLCSTFTETEQKAFTVQENYKKTQEFIDQHKDVLDKAKSDCQKLKKKKTWMSCGQLRSAQLLFSFFFFFL
ncbi:structural maintenance of chromosomes protein 4-like isoform X2 [Henckelia pumila]|uniref:structural maintenance of chromosomes protein 4-like isoform X2 n=1 Tax=Henckelia pumila TaxID=405737 RepID=UPI003C6DDFB8